MKDRLNFFHFDFFFFLQMSLGSLSSTFLTFFIKFTQLTVCFGREHLSKSHPIYKNVKYKMCYNKLAHFKIKQHNYVPRVRVKITSVNRVM